MYIDDAIIVSGDESIVRELWADVITVAKESSTLLPNDCIYNTDFAGLVSDVIIGMVNFDATFMIAPDGAREGYPESNAAAVFRSRVLNLIKSYPNHVRCVAVRYGRSDQKSPSVVEVTKA